jgi:hypothetical protein
MELYICYGTFKSPRPGGHPCRVAYEGLREAGYDPELIKSYGLAVLPAVFNQTSGRRKAKELTGGYAVPVLVTDDGEVVSDSKQIVAWAKQHPAAPQA